MKTNKHLLPHGDMWAVKSEGASRPAKIFMTKADALKYAHDMSMRDDSCIFVHKKDGKVSHVTCPARKRSALLRSFQKRYGLSS